MKRPDGSLAVSIVLHIVLGAALLWVLSIPTPFHEWGDHRQPPPTERIGYVTLPSGGAPTRGRSGGNGRPIEKTRAPTRAAPLTAPTSVPTAVPRPAPSATGAGGGTGPVVGAGGLERGVTPSFDDPRVWLPPGQVEWPPKKYTQALDSVLASRIQAHNDSVAAVASNAGRAPGDWTFQKNGKKYGIDQHKIYIGDHSIPSAILALLPLNTTANPTQLQQDRALAYQRNDIQYQAQRAMNEQEFREAVKRIRERKQREHDEEMKRREDEKKKAQAQKEIAGP